MENSCTCGLLVLKLSAFIGALDWYKNKAIPLSGSEDRQLNYKRLLFCNYLDQKEEEKKQ